MASPQRSDYQFNEFNVALFVGSYIAIVKDILKEYRITFSDVRILCAIEGLVQLYGWRLQKMGISRLQIMRLTSFSRVTSDASLRRLVERDLVTMEAETYGKRIVYRYTLTRQGKAIVNRMTKVDRVNETIIGHLYGKRLLK